jgi:ATP-binding protein involved in chromosome partitioning
MSAVRNEDVLKALATVEDPDLHRDLVTLGMIEDVAIEDGRVSFSLVLTTAACPLKAEIEAQCRAAVSALPSVREVVIRTTARMRKAKDPTADRKALPGVAQVIAIGAGKGGVGKSTVAANLAAALAATGARVGLLDGDIYGPNLPRMLGVNRQPSQRDNKIVPLEAWGVRFMSMGWSPRAKRWCGAGRCCTGRSRASCTTWTGASSTTCWWISRPGPATSSSRSSSRRSWPAR